MHISTAVGVQEGGAAGVPRLGALSESLQSCDNRMQQQPFLQQGGEDAEVCSETLQVTLLCCFRL